MSANDVDIRTRSRRTVIAGVLATALAVVTAQPAIAEPDTVTALQTFASTSGDYGVVLGQHSVGGGLQVTAYNRSSTAREFGMGSDLRAPEDMTHLWMLGIPDFADTFKLSLSPGATEARDIPSWPGETYTFYTDLGGSQPELGRYRVPGNWQPVEFVSDEQNNFTDTHVGYDLRLSSSTVPAGGGISVSSDIPDRSGLGVYLVPTSNMENAFDTQTYVVDPRMAAGLRYFPDSGQVRSIGTVMADSGGVHDAAVTIPVDVVPGEYGLFLGDKSTGFYPVGPYSTNQTSNITILARGATPTGTDVAITPVDQSGGRSVDLTFASVQQPGTTTVTTATTGPAATGFSLLGSSPVYYNLETTATFSGSVRVCVKFDTTGLDTTTTSSQHLYHYTGGTWVDITTQSGSGFACGDTSSFSPFAIGTPRPVEPTLQLITPTKSTGNIAVAGLPYAIAFKGKSGLKLASGSPVSQQIDCRTSAAIGAAVPATRTKTAPFVYVPKLGVYTYRWETSTSWRSTCRSFTLRLDGGAGSATAAFTFK